MFHFFCFGQTCFKWVLWIYDTCETLWENYLKWASTWRIQQNVMYAQRILRSAWAYAHSEQSLPCTLWVAKDPSFLHVYSKDSDQTERMPRLIWVFAGHTCHFVGFVMGWHISKDRDQSVYLHGCTVYAFLSLIGYKVGFPMPKFISFDLDLDHA